MNTSLSESKRKIMLRFINNDNIYNLLDFPVEYRDDLIFTNIFPYIKIDGTVEKSDVYLGIGIDYPSINNNEIFKNANITILIVCNNQKIKVGAKSRTDLLSEEIDKSLNWSDFLGFKIKLVSDFEDALNENFYYRKMIFKSVSPNSMTNHAVKVN